MRSNSGKKTAGRSKSKSNVMKIEKEDSPFKVGRFDLIGWSDPFPEQNKIMAKLLKFDTLVYAKSLF